MAKHRLIDALVDGDQDRAMELARDVECRRELFEDGSSAFHLAIRSGMYSVADVLLDEGIDLGVQDRYGMSAVHTLIVRIGVGREGAAPQGDSAAVALLARLVNGGADLTLRRHEDECTPLMLAAAYGLEDVVSLLLEAGAGASDTSVGGSALNRAAEEGHAEAVRLLLRHGANVNDRDQSGQTPLLKASLNGHLPCVMALLEGGADPNVQTKSGFTGLMHASYKGYSEIVRLSLEHGASPRLRDQNGNSAKEYAVGGGASHIIPLLEAHSGRWWEF